MINRRAIFFAVPALVPEAFWPFEFFTPVELQSKDGAGLLADYHALARLEAIRRDAGFPFIITSAYRSIPHNRSVGGKDHSYHIQGRAFDIAATGNEALWIALNARNYGFGGLSTYPNFVHIDDGPKRTWASS